PLRITQGMEVSELLSDAPRLPVTDNLEGTGHQAPTWRGGTSSPVEGGRLRLAHLRQSLPGNVGFLRLVYGDLLLGMALLGALIGLVERRTAVIAPLPYMLAALFLYSCWVRPSPRYLAGIELFLPVLIVEGVFGPLDLIRRRDAGALARLLGVVVGAALL